MFIIYVYFLFFSFFFILFEKEEKIKKVILSKFVVYEIKQNKKEEDQMRETHIHTQRE